MQRKVTLTLVYIIAAVLLSGCIPLAKEITFYAGSAADGRNTQRIPNPHRKVNIDKRWLFLGAYEWAVFSSAPIVITSRKMGAPNQIVVAAGVAGCIGGSIYGYNWAKNVMIRKKGWWGRWEEPTLGIFSCALLATMILITTSALTYAGEI